MSARAADTMDSLNDRSALSSESRLESRHDSERYYDVEGSGQTKISVCESVAQKHSWRCAHFRNELRGSDVGAISSGSEAIWSGSVVAMAK